MTDPRDVRDYGFFQDGYDYSQHLANRGQIGGAFYHAFQEEEGATNDGGSEPVQMFFPQLRRVGKKNMDRDLLSHIEETERQKEPIEGTVVVDEGLQDDFYALAHGQSADVDQEKLQNDEFHTAPADPDLCRHGQYVPSRGGVSSTEYEQLKECLRNESIEDMMTRLGIDDDDDEEFDDDLPWDPTTQPQPHAQTETQATTPSSHAHAHAHAHAPQPRPHPPSSGPDLAMKYHDRMLDAKFNRVIGEFEDDKIGALDDECEAEEGTEAQKEKMPTKTLDQFDDILNEFLAEQTQTYRTDVDEEPPLPPSDPSTPPPTAAPGASSPEEVMLPPAPRGARRVNPLHEDADRLDVPLSEHEKIKLIALAEQSKDTAPIESEAFKKDRRGDWDCQSILSTYTNLDNHPSVIGEPASHPRIHLTKRGLPVVIHELRDRRKASRVADEEEEEEEEEEEKGPAVSRRPANESAEEKRARKKAVKLERKQRRLQKKALKVAFRTETQQHQTLTAQLPQDGLSLSEL